MPSVVDDITSTLRTYLSPGTTVSDINRLRFTVARALCEHLQLTVTPTGRSGAVRVDYLRALDFYVSPFHCFSFTVLL